MKTIEFPINGVLAKLTVISDDHVSIIIEHDTPLTLNRVPIYGRVDLYLWESDLEWHRYPAWAEGEYTLRSPYTSSVARRADKTFTDASTATEKKFVEILTDAVTAWAHTDEALADLVDAGSARREADASSAVLKAEEAERRAAQLRSEADLLRQGGRIIFYVKSYESGFSETRKAIVTMDGQRVDTVEQPGKR